jgi:predicted RNase H-like nuclease (RuvC/YqgF family)
VERESHLRLKKPYEDLQAMADQYERSYNDIHDKYRDLIATKLKLESDSLVVQQDAMEETATDVLAKANGTDEERPASDREVQLQNEIKQLQLKNESLSEGLRKMEQMWQMMQTKMEDYEEQIEGKAQFFVVSSCYVDSSGQ